MPHTDHTKDPAVVTLMPHEVKNLTLLKEGPIGEVDMSILGDGMKLVGPQYTQEDLYNHTKHMMRLLMINYRSPNNPPKLENIPVEIREKLKPFAHFLALIDGNDFEGLVDQYIPDVYAFMVRGDHSFIDETLEKIHNPKA